MAAHILHLLGRCWSLFLAWNSASTLSVIRDFVIAFGIFAMTARLTLGKGWYKPSALRSSTGKQLVVTLAAGIGVLLAFVGLVFLATIPFVVWQYHSDLLGEVNVLKGQAKELQSENDRLKHPGKPPRVSSKYDLQPNVLFINGGPLKNQNGTNVRLIAEVRNTGVEQTPALDWHLTLIDSKTKRRTAMEQKYLNASETVTMNPPHGDCSVLNESDTFYKKTAPITPGDFIWGLLEFENTNLDVRTVSSETIFALSVSDIAGNTYHTRVTLGELNKRPPTTHPWPHIPCPPEPK